MISAKKLQCLTTSSWLMGYAETLDEYDDKRLIHMLVQAATLLRDSWDEYEAGLTPKSAVASKE